MPFFEVSVQPSEINGGKKETGKMLMSRRKRARIQRMRMCRFVPLMLVDMAMAICRARSRRERGWAI